MSHISIKRLAYYRHFAHKSTPNNQHKNQTQNGVENDENIDENSDENPKILLNYALAPIKPKASLTKISCAKFSELMMCNIQEKELEQESNKWQINSDDYAPKSDIYATLYQHCIKKGIFEKDINYILSFVKSKNGNLRVFAMREEEAYCDILVPFLLLPFALKANPNGVFLLDSWLMLYENGELLYDSYCPSVAELKSGLAFLNAAYGKQNPQIFYLDGFIEKMLDCPKTREPQDTIDFQNATDFNDSSDLEAIVSLASFKKIESTKEKLCFDFVLQSELQSQSTKPFASPHSLDFAHTLNDLDAHFHNQNTPHIPKPLYNTSKKHFLQTHSFWASIKALACCALVFALPCCKLGYASYLQSQATKLKEANTITNQNLQATNNKNTLQNIEYLNATLRSLAQVRKPYMPRLEIISNISTIASKNAVWIGNLAIYSNENSTMQSAIDFRPNSQNSHHKDFQANFQANLNENPQKDFVEHIKNPTITLGIYANEPTHIQNFIKEIQSSAYFAFVDYQTDGSDLADDSSQESKDIFSANIFAQIATTL